MRPILSVAWRKDETTRMGNERETSESALKKKNSHGAVAMRVAAIMVDTGRRSNSVNRSEISGHAPACLDDLIINSSASIVSYRLPPWPQRREFHGDKITWVWIRKLRINWVWI